MGDAPALDAGAAATQTPAPSPPPGARTSVFQKLKDEFAPKLMAGAVTAIGGYLAAFIISPEQVYRRFWLSDSDNYVGRWVGTVGGRYAELHIRKQIRDPNGRTSEIGGTLIIGSGPKQMSIAIKGGADSRVTLSGLMNPSQEISITLDRTLSAIKTPDEHYVRLIPRAGEQAASLCPVVSDPLKMSTRWSCTPIGGATYFTF